MKMPLNFKSVSYTTEQAGLILATRAVEWCVKRYGRGLRFHVRTDSQSALRSLEKPGCDDNLESEIIKRLHGATWSADQIRLSWVRGHSGVQGSEAADAAAGEAAQDACVTVIPLSTLKSTLQTHAKKRAAEELKQVGAGAAVKKRRSNPAIRNGD